MAASLTLYEATDALGVVREWLDAHEDEIIAGGGEIPPALAELIDQAEGDFDRKVERVGLFIQERLGQAQMVRAEAARLATRAAQIDKQAETMKRYLLQNLMRANRKKVEGKLLDVRVQANAIAVKQDFTAEQLEQLHRSGCAFTAAQTMYTLPSSGVQAAVKDALATIGKAPELGSDNYAEASALWLQMVHEELAKAGVPAGVRIERGHHVRLR